VAVFSSRPPDDVIAWACKSDVHGWRLAVGGVRCGKMRGGGVGRDPRMDDVSCATCPVEGRFRIHLERRNGGDTLVNSAGGGLLTLEPNAVWLKLLLQIGNQLLGSFRVSAIKPNFSEPSVAHFPSHVRRRNEGQF
jgi:hypothetical protein